MLFIRLAIAASLEHAYEPLPVQEAAELLYFKEAPELVTFARQVRESRRDPTIMSLGHLTTRSRRVILISTYSFIFCLMIVASM
jgi:hypothetical protein